MSHRVGQRLVAADARARLALRDYRERVAVERSGESFRSALESALPIDGFTAPVELGLLHWLARAQAPRGRVVEIGSYLGRSTVVLAAATAEVGGAPVCAVDPHIAALTIEVEQPRDTREEFLANVARAQLAEHVELIHTFSVEAAAGWRGDPISLLFIDGYHTVEAVLEDWNSWQPYLTHDACVVFDDFLPFPGVRAAVRRLLAAGVLPESRLIAGKMLAVGPRAVMAYAPTQPGGRLLARLNDRALDRLIRVLAS
jgi:predicted O-methyltransferase YrrM